MAPGQRNMGRGSAQTQVHNAPSATTTTTTTGPSQAVLRLRGASRGNEEVGGVEGARRHIQWAEDVIDNEGLGKKKSKVCCIYHAPKGIDESSDESSSDDDSESDSGDDGAARPIRGSGEHNHGHDHEHNHGKGKGRAKSPNAYEKIPKPKGGRPKEKSR